MPHLDRPSTSLPLLTQRTHRNQKRTCSPSDFPGRLRAILRDELNRLATWGERHRRLGARLLVAFLLTLVIDLVGALLVWRLEASAKGTEIHGFGDAIFFSTVQLLTVSSQIRNPLTAGGRIVDVGLELWAIFVVSAVAGSFAAFFAAADDPDPRVTA
jgi:hypothetical protein